MAGTRSALRAARVAVIAFAVLLAGGAVGAWFLGAQALESARAQATSDASGVTDELLTEVFTGADLSAPVSAARAREIEDALERSALASSGFGMITVWRDDGQVVFSQDRNLLAARLPSEASHLRAVLRNGAASEVENGTFSAFVPLTKGTINAVAELDRPYAPIARSAVPLRIASGLLLVLCLATTYVVHRLSRAIASATANAAFRPTQGLGDVRQAPQHEQIGGRGRGIRARSVEQAPAPDPVDRRRTKELEEQVRVLQEQFRNSLAELQATERRLQDATSASGR